MRISVRHPAFSFFEIFRRAEAPLAAAPIDACGFMKPHGLLLLGSALLACAAGGADARAKKGGAKKVRRQSAGGGEDCQGWVARRSLLARAITWRLATKPPPCQPRDGTTRPSLACGAPSRSALRCRTDTTT